MVCSSGKSNVVLWNDRMKAIPIVVNGIVFPSARAAARYIVTEESKRGNGRKVNTVHKELKRAWHGACWYMYERWMVSQVIIAVEAEALGPSAD